MGDIIESENSLTKAKLYRNELGYSLYTDGISEVGCFNPLD